MNKDLLHIYGVGLAIIVVGFLLHDKQETPLPEKHDYLLSFLYYTTNDVSPHYTNVMVNSRTITKEHIAYVSNHITTNLLNVISNSVNLIVVTKLDNQ